MKRITAFFILITILFSCISITYAKPFDKNELFEKIAESTDKYTCGDDMTALLISGTLIISGSGNMYDYGYGTAPWAEKSESITEVKINDGVESIGDCAFSGCTNLKSIDIADSVEKIGKYIVSDCKNLKEFNIPDSVTEISPYAFSAAGGLEEISLSSNLKTIPAACFNCCFNLLSITIPDKVTNIGDGAFLGCKNLSKIDMTLSIRKIGNQAFKDCNSLEYIYYDGSVDDWDNIDISDNNESLQNSDIEFAKEYTDTDESYDDEEDYDSNDYADENYNDEDYNDDEYNDDEYNDDDYDDNDYNDEDYENYDDNDNYDYNYNEPSYWAVTEVNNAIKNGLVTESVAYDYHAYITREQFCEMVVLAYESLSGKTASAGSAWFRDTTNKEILKAANLGIVNGYETGHFKPNELITREQIAAMVVRMLGVSVKGVNIHNYSQHYFTDRYEISDWALPSVNFAYENGIMNGVGNNTIAPKRNTTCEEAVLLINRTYEKYKNYKADATDKPVDKTNMTEKELLDSFLLLNTDGLSDYLYFLPDDYDGDGKLEAFIITGNKLDDYNCNNVTVWFVANSGGCSAVERNLYGYLSDAVKADSDKFIVWEKNAGGSGSKSYIFGCYNDDAYQPEISGKYGDFYKDENGVYTAFSDSFSNGYHDYVTHTFDYDFANHEFTENTNN